VAGRDETLLLVAERNGPEMLARIGILLGDQPARREGDLDRSHDVRHSVRIVSAGENFRYG
jgi:hypothetical protein